MNKLLSTIKWKNMPTEIIDVIDTAVKIGLGSFITGVATFSVHRYNGSKEKNRYILEHKIETLEMASIKIEEYFTAWGILVSLAGGMGRRLEQQGKPLVMSDKHRVSLREKDKELIDSWAGRSVAISRLTLIGADSIVQILEEASELQKLHRDKIIFNQELISKSEYEDLSKLAKDLKKKIYSETAEFYNKLLA